MGMMGWSSSSMARRYQHITEPIRRDIARRVGGLIWPSDEDDGGSNGYSPGSNETKTDSVLRSVLLWLLVVRVRVEGRLVWSGSGCFHGL
jgi:hypothetical protein